MVFKLDTTCKASTPQPQQDKVALLCGCDQSQGEVIGCAQIKPHRDGSRELASLVVHPDYRGQGIARRMIQYLTKHMLETCI